MNNSLDTCPVCDSEDIGKEIIEKKFRYGASELVVPNYTIFKCGECGETFPDKSQSKVLEPTIRDFHREVDGLLTSSDIKYIRNGLGYTQEKFGDLLGGGAKAFARYETGTVTQSKPMDNLLRIIWHYPSAISILSNKSDIRIKKFEVPTTSYMIQDDSEIKYNEAEMQHTFKAVGT